MAEFIFDLLAALGETAFRLILILASIKILNGKDR